MPRRKVVRTFEEEEEYQRNKREKKAKSQKERREIKRIIAKKDNIVHEISGEINTVSQVTERSINNNFSLLRNSENNAVSHNSVVRTINNHIISPIPSTSHNVINLDNNTSRELNVLHEYHLKLLTIKQ